MEFIESLDIILRECRFVASASDLERLIPGAAGALPPLMSIRYADDRAPLFHWGYPIIPSRQHLRHFQQLFAKVCENALRTPGYQEDLQSLSPDVFREDPYLKEISSLLVQTLAEGHFLKLDTILWLSLADTLRRRFNADNKLEALTQALLPGEMRRHGALDQALGKLKFRDSDRLAEAQRACLHSFIARFEYGWSTVKEVFGEIPTNPIARGMFSHRFVYTLPKDGLYGIEGFGAAIAVGNYRLKAESFQSLRRLLSRIILGSLERRGAGRLNPADAYLLRMIDLEVATEKARLGLANAMMGAGIEARERALMEGIAAYLSLQPECYRYLFFHLDDLSGFLIKPVEDSLNITREQLKAFKDPRRVVALEAAYSDIAEDLRRWDVFNTLIGHIHWVDATTTGGLQAGGRPLVEAAVPINLDAIHQIYRRSRRGTAVFVDLIGFTAKTKTLSRGSEARGTGEEASTFSLLSLAIQRLFSVRRFLKVYGGSPQGFEGDAILDIFPEALNALRYISRFSDNYEANRLLTYRPFEGPAGNPYQEGWRVGLATGPYTVISLVGRSNEMSPDAVHERAVGHTVNRASRLNSGKKGASLLLGEEAGGGQLYDPLNLFRANVDGALKLSNNGICSFEDTFLEIKEAVKAEGLAFYCPASKEGGEVCGELPIFGHYDLEMVFHDEEIGKVILIRQLPREPELKGLEDESCIVYEYVLIPGADFPALLLKDKALGPPPPKGDVGALGPIDLAGLQTLRQWDAQGLSPRDVILREESAPAEISTPLPTSAPEPSPSANYSGGSPPPPPEGTILASTTASAQVGSGPIPASNIQASAPPNLDLLSSTASGARGEEALSFLSDGGDLPGNANAWLDLTSGGDEALGEADFLVDPLAHDGDSLALTAEAPPPVDATPRGPTEIRPSLNGDDERGGGSLLPSLEKAGATGQGTLAASLESSGGARGGGEIEASLEKSGGARGAGPLQASLETGGVRGEGTIPASLTAQSTPMPPPPAAPTPSPATPSSAPVIPSSLYVDKGDLEGYGYVLEEGMGPDQPPTAILVGCPRGQVLQDCHRYEPEMMAPRPWTLDEVLARFVLELDQELKNGSARGAHQLKGGEQVYMLDAAYLFNLARGLLKA